MRRLRSSGEASPLALQLFFNLQANKFDLHCSPIVRLSVSPSAGFEVSRKWGFPVMSSDFRWDRSATAPEVGESLAHSAPAGVQESSRISRSAVRSLIVFCVAYILACRYSEVLGSSTPAPLWFPDPVLLCALLLAPRRLWRWYLLLGLPIRLLNVGGPHWFVAATYVNDSLKATLCVYVLHRHSCHRGTDTLGSCGRGDASCAC